MARRSIDNRLDFLSPVDLIPGLGPKRVAALRESGISNLGDLLHHFPLRYVDRSVITPIKDASRFTNVVCSIVGAITRTRVEKGRKARLRIQVTDATGSMEVLWFRSIQMYRHSLRAGMHVVLTGKISSFGTPQLVHPLVESLGEGQDRPEIPFLPVYPLTAAMRDTGVRQKVLLKAIRWALDTVKHYPQVLPAQIEKCRNLAPLSECIRQMHLPDDPSRIDSFLVRIKYEEIYQFAVSLRLSRKRFRQSGRSLHPGGLPAKLRSFLPFTLTEGQEAAIRVLFEDAARKGRMHRLLHGDVGSGKTIVAFFACLPALNEGYQACWLAPTEILARQILSRLSDWLSSLGIRAGLLTGSLPPHEKAQIVRAIATGDLDFVVGTHALLQPSVTFAKLGVAIVDEQHRFGVGQRIALQEKDPRSDFLLVSATPIPRTLAQTVYGDLDIVTIAQGPSGPSAVKTHLVPERKRNDMETFILREIQQRNARAFYVVPRIDSEEEEKVRDVMTVSEVLAKTVFSSIECAVVHGRMGADEKESAMASFTRGNARVLFATTVVEVGIDVPDASIMVIENAERFGLSQLHQLRGRVGRGDRSKPSYCFLPTHEPPGSVALERMELFCRTADGFEIADLDLRLRGPGELSGLRQSGWSDDLRFTDLTTDARIFDDVQSALDLVQVPE